MLATDALRVYFLRGFLLSCGWIERQDDMSMRYKRQGRSFSQRQGEAASAAWSSSGF